MEHAIDVVSDEYPKGTTFEAPALPKGADTGPAYFVSSILNDTPIEGMTNPYLCRDIQEVMDAAYESMETRKHIDLKPTETQQKAG